MRNQSARFPRSARLLRHADFERVYKHGRRHFSSTMTVFYLQREPQAGSSPSGSSPSTSGCRVGFTVSRAHGGAVVRNRMKRRLREAVRLSRPPVTPDVDVVINPKKALLSADFPSIVNEVARAFVVIGKMSQEPNSASREQKFVGSTNRDKPRSPKAESRKPN
jgi:ribonuclease P protein component